MKDWLLLNGFVLKLDSCWMRSLTSQWFLAGLRGGSATLELRYGSNLDEGSSEEYWTMCESMIQQYCVNERKTIVVKLID